METSLRRNRTLRFFRFICINSVWRNGCVMDCHATTRGSIPGRDGVKTELHVLRKASKWGRRLEKTSLLMGR